MKAGPLAMSIVLFGCERPQAPAREAVKQLEPAPARTDVGVPADRDEAVVKAQAEAAAVDAKPPIDASTVPEHHGEILAGDNLSRILRRAGLDARVTHDLGNALSAVMDPGALQPGQTYDLTVDGSGRLTRFELVRSRVLRVVVERDEQGRLTARAVEEPTQLVEEVFSTTIDSSLWAAVVDRGGHPSLVDHIIDVFAYDIDFFSEPRRGDRFRAVVERIEIGGELLHYGRILAAEYSGQLGTRRAFWWDAGDGRGRYVDDEGRSIARTLLKTPLKYSRVSSEFNPRRMHPVLHRVKGHNGTDYAAPEGTAVWAAAAGTIVFRGPKGGAGNMVVLSHADGMKTQYMHLSRFRDGQKVGSTVEAKTVIGYVGQTGLATGPHLHFGVTIGGRYVDPQSIGQHRGPGVLARDRARWKTHRRRWLERLDHVRSAELDAVADVRQAAGPPP